MNGQIWASTGSVRKMSSAVSNRLNTIIKPCLTCRKKQLHDGTSLPNFTQSLTHYCRDVDLATYKLQTGNTNHLLVNPVSTSA